MPTTPPVSTPRAAPTNIAVDDQQRRNGKAIAEQPYSVDPNKTPKVGQGAAGPKRSQEQSGQALQDPQEGDEDGK